MIKKKVYIVSLCLKKLKNCTEPSHEFHFKGFYRGVRVERLIVLGGEFEQGNEYLIKAQTLAIEEGALICRANKSRLVFSDGR